MRTQVSALGPEEIRAATAYGAASVAHEEVVLLSNAPVRP
jgi:hypothetical protein